MDLVYKELKYFKDVHKVEYNYFWADTFLGMSNNELDEFCEMYSEIHLPFWMQTRPETINDENMSKLKFSLQRECFLFNVFITSALLTSKSIRKGSNIGACWGKFGSEIHLKNMFK